MEKQSLIGDLNQTSQLLNTNTTNNQEKSLLDDLVSTSTERLKLPQKASQTGKKLPSARHIKLRKENYSGETNDPFNEKMAKEQTEKLDDQELTVDTHKNDSGNEKQEQQPESKKSRPVSGMGFGMLDFSKVNLKNGNNTLRPKSTSTKAQPEFNSLRLKQTKPTDVAKTPPPVVMPVLKISQPNGFLKPLKPMLKPQPQPTSKTTATPVLKVVSTPPQNPLLKPMLKPQLQPASKTMATPVLKAVSIPPQSELVNSTKINSNPKLVPTSEPQMQQVEILKPTDTNSTPELLPTSEPQMQQIEILKPTDTNSTPELVPTSEPQMQQIEILKPTDTNSTPELVPQSEPHEQSIENLKTSQTSPPQSPVSEKNPEHSSLSLERVAKRTDTLRDQSIIKSKREKEEIVSEKEVDLSAEEASVQICYIANEIEQKLANAFGTLSEAQHKRLQQFFSLKLKSLTNNNASNIQKLNYFQEQLEKIQSSSQTSVLYNEIKKLSVSSDPSHSEIHQLAEKNQNSIINDSYYQKQFLAPIIEHLQKCIFNVTKIYLSVEEEKNVDAFFKVRFPFNQLGYQKMAEKLKEIQGVILKADTMDLVNFLFDCFTVDTKVNLATKLDFAGENQIQKLNFINNIVNRFETKAKDVVKFSTIRPFIEMHINKGLEAKLKEMKFDLPPQVFQKKLNEIAELVNEDEIFEKSIISVNQESCEVCIKAIEEVLKKKAVLHLKEPDKISVEIAQFAKTFFRVSPQDWKLEPSKFYGKLEDQTSNFDPNNVMLEFFRILLNK